MEATDTPTSVAFNKLWNELDRYYTLIQKVQREARQWENTQDSGPPLGTPKRLTIPEIRDELLHGALAAHQEKIGRLLGRW